MGLYIEHDLHGNRLPVTGKSVALIISGAKHITREISFQPNMICVVENGPFDAAGWCFSRREFQAFNAPDDFRRKSWFVVPKEFLIEEFSQTSYDEMNEE